MSTAIQALTSADLRRRLIAAAPPLSEQKRAELRELFRLARKPDEAT